MIGQQPVQRPFPQPVTQDLPWILEPLLNLLSAQRHNLNHPRSGHIYQGTIRTWPVHLPARAPNDSNQTSDYFSTLLGWLARFQAGHQSVSCWEPAVLAVGWSSGEADADVGDDGAVLADEDRVQVELGDLGDVLDHGADPVQQLGEGRHVQRGGIR
jgi:hypothetical protein